MPAICEEVEESVMLTYYSDYGFSLDMTREDVESVSQQGDNYENLHALVRFGYISEQLDKISSDDIRRELKSTGGWDEEQLEDDYENQCRLLFVVAGYLKSELE